MAKTFVPPNTPEITPADGSARSDPHLAWAEEWCATLNKYNGLGKGRRGVRADFDRQDELKNLILDTEPRTVSGLAVQLMLLLDLNLQGVPYTAAVEVPVLQRAADMLPLPSWKYFYDHQPAEA